MSYLLNQKQETNVQCVCPATTTNANRREKSVGPGTKVKSDLNTKACQSTSIRREKNGPAASGHNCSSETTNPSSTPMKVLASWTSETLKNNLFDAEKPQRKISDKTKLFRTRPIPFPQSINKGLQMTSNHEKQKLVIDGSSHQDGQNRVAKRTSDLPNQDNVPSKSFKMGSNLHDDKLCTKAQGMNNKPLFNCQRTEKNSISCGGTKQKPPDPQELEKISSSEEELNQIPHDSQSIGQSSTNVRGMRQGYKNVQANRQSSSDFETIRQSSTNVERMKSGSKNVVEGIRQRYKNFQDQEARQDFGGVGANRPSYQKEKIQRFPFLSGSSLFQKENENKAIFKSAANGNILFSLHCNVDMDKISEQLMCQILRRMYVNFFRAGIDFKKKFQLKVKRNERSLNTEVTFPRVSLGREKLSSFFFSTPILQLKSKNDLPTTKRASFDADARFQSDATKFLSQSLAHSVEHRPFEHPRVSTVSSNDGNLIFFEEPIMKEKKSRIENVLQINPIITEPTPVKFDHLVDRLEYTQNHEELTEKSAVDSRRRNNAKFHQILSSPVLNEATRFPELNERLDCTLFPTEKHKIMRDMIEEIVQVKIFQYYLKLFEAFLKCEASVRSGNETSLMFKKRYFDWDRILHLLF